jgi:energy-coupling factor transporter ATP-binding protein EcfA2
MKSSAVITSITVNSLFGQMNYVLDLSGRADDPASHISILYGDNGSGKTTILKLLYHLLSPVDDKSHKTYLKQIPFNYFAVSLNTGITVVAKRPDKSIKGPLLFEIRNATTLLNSLPESTTDKTEDENESAKRVELVARFLKSLSELNIEIFFLRDNRFFTTSLDDISAKIDFPEPTMAPEDTLRASEFRRSTHKDEQRKLPTLLDRAIAKVESHFRQQTLSGSYRGEGDANTIYASVIEQLITTQGHNTSSKPNEIEFIVKRLEELALRNQSFVEIGLTSQLLLKNLTSSLRTVQTPFQEPIMNVLKLYIETVEARLNALNDTKEAISNFIASLNEFLVNKQAAFDITSGFRIFRSDGDELDPNHLSSGERQLLFIFCRIILPKRLSSLFIIDEPEISLNVKWQRNLISHLLRCTQNEPIQFLLASHSIELLTQFNNRVTPLEHINSNAKDFYPEKAN